MRGRFPLPPIPGKPQGAASPTPREGVKTPPYKQTRKPPPTQTPGPGMPGPYRAAARKRLLT